MNRLIANLSSFITSYKRDDIEGTTVGNFSLDTDWSTFVFSWSNDSSNNRTCLLYTSPSPRDRQKSRMPSSA